jgi:hypothetical protein
MVHLINLDLLLLFEYILIIYSGLLGYIYLPIPNYTANMFIILIFANILNIINIILSTNYFLTLLKFIINYDYYHLYLNFIKSEKESIVIDMAYNDVENQVLYEQEYLTIMNKNIDMINNKIVKLKLVEDFIGKDKIIKVSYKIKKKIINNIQNKISKTYFGYSLINIEEILDLYLHIMIKMINYYLNNTKYRVILEKNELKIVMIEDDKLYYTICSYDSKLRKNIKYYLIDYTSQIYDKACYLFDNCKIINTNIVYGISEKMILIDYFDNYQNKIFIKDLFDLE